MIVMEIIMVLLLDLGLMLLLRLQLWATLVVSALSLVAFVRHKKKYRKQKLEERRFLEASEYMDAVLYNFLREEKIEKTFENLVSIIEPSHMLSVVENALEHMKLTFDETQVYRDALRMIEQEYDNEKLRHIHDFMYQVESYGGEIGKSVDILLEDKNYWEKRILCGMEDRKRMFRQIVMSVVASIAICGIILHMPIRNLDISGNIIGQIVAVVVLILDDCIVLRAQKYMAPDWLTLEEKNTSTSEAEKMRRWRSFNPSREHTLSLGLGTFGAAVSGLLFWRFGLGFAYVGFLFTCILVNQHRIGRYLLRKNITRSIRSRFPQWLLNIVLLLQTENVQVSLQKSFSMAPDILREDLRILNEQIEISPEGALPYHSFLEEFHIPEIHSAMSMLYSMSMGNSMNSERQLEELIHRNLAMMDNTEREELKNRTARMYLLFLAPVLTASIKLLTDMMIVMLSFLSSFGV